MQITATSDYNKNLLQHLHSLQDRGQMIRLFENALSLMRRTRLEVLDYKIHFSKLHVDRYVSIFFEMKLKEQASGKVFTLPCSCIFGSEERRRKDCINYPLNEVHKKKFELLGFSAFEACLEEAGMALRLFPGDSCLKGLSLATDPDLLRELFPPFYGKLPIVIDVLNYKPCTSCALHYKVIGNDGEIVYQTFGKLYPNLEDHKCHLMQSASWEISQKSGGLWAAPRPVRHTPEWAFIMQERVPGRQIGALFTEIPFGCLEKCLGRVILALRSYQTSAVLEESIRDFPVLFGEQEKTLSILHKFSPEIASEIEALREKILLNEHRIPRSPLCFSHGDFAYWNVMVEESLGQVGIIDFDRAGHAEMALDPAYFLCNLVSLSVRKPEHSSRYLDIYRFFREKYLEEASEVASERLAFYEVLELSSYILRSFRKNTDPHVWKKCAQNLLNRANCLSKDFL